MTARPASRGRCSGAGIECVSGFSRTRGHVIYKNLRLLRTLGVDDDRVAFPLAQVDSDALREIRASRGGERPFALINPGAAWPNKRWPSERYGEVAAFLSDVRQLRSVVLWGPGEEALARAVAERIRRLGARGAAHRARRSPRAVARRVVDGVRRHRSAAHRGRCRHADGVDVRSDRSGSERTVGAGRCDRVAVRVVRVPLRAALSSTGRLVSRRSAGLRSDRGDSAAARQRPSGGAGGMTSSLLRAIARRRVTIGFVSSALAAVARAAVRAQPAAGGAAVAIAGRSDARVGGRSSREGPRGHDVGSVRVHAASAVSRVDAHRDRPGDRVGQRRLSRRS